MSILLINNNLAFGTLEEKVGASSYSVPTVGIDCMITHTNLPIILRGFSWAGRDGRQRIAEWSTMEVSDDLLSYFTRKETFVPLNCATVRQFETLKEQE